MIDATLMEALRALSPIIERIVVVRSKVARCRSAGLDPKVDLHFSAANIANVPGRAGQLTGTSLLRISARTVSSSSWTDFRCTTLGLPSCATQRESIKGTGTKGRLGGSMGGSGPPC